MSVEVNQTKARPRKGLAAASLVPEEHGSQNDHSIDLRKKVSRSRKGSQRNGSGKEGETNCFYCRPRLQHLAIRNA